MMRPFGAGLQQVKRQGENVVEVTLKGFAASERAPYKSHAAGLICFFPLFLIAAVTAVYWNAFSVPFIYDDKTWILANRSLHELLPASPPGPRWFSKFTFALNYKLDNYNPTGYHIFNLLIHAGSALVYYGILRRTLGVVFFPSIRRETASVLAFFSALLWAVHPLHTESVTYIVQRHESLMGLFGLLLFYSFVRAVSSSRSYLWYGAGALAYLLGLGCKEVIVGVPVVILLYDSLFLSSGRRKGAKARVWFYAVLCLCTLTVWPSMDYLLTASGENVSAGLGLKGITPLEYAALQPGVMMKYLRLAVWPHPLNIHYYVSEPVRPLFGIIPITAVFIFAVFMIKKNRAAAFLLLSFFLLLAPSSSIVPLKDAAAEHRLYLPLTLYAAGLVAILFSLLSQRAAAGRSSLRMMLSVITIVYLIVPSFLTVYRNGDYHDEAVLWEKSLALEPGNARAHNSAALIYMERGNVGEGIRHLQAAINLMPDYPSPYLNLGLCYESLGNSYDAEVQYQNSLRLHPGSSDALSNLGNLYIKRGDLEKAEEFFIRALSSNPHHTVTLMNYAGLLYMKNDKTKAEAMYRQALQINIYDADVWSSLGFLLGESGRIPEAKECFRRALEIKPEHSQAAKNMARFSSPGDKQHDA